ncbi:MAG: hypothetical protein U0414_13655 [Polyangiaceae bacterium]
MKHYSWILLAGGGLVAIALSAAACDDSSTGTGGTGTTSSSTKATTTTSTTKASTSVGSTSSGGTSLVADCTAPATSPSMGTCWTGKKTPPTCPHPGQTGMCTGIIMNPNACGTCLETSCCTEMNACQADMTCKGCFDGSITGAMCDAAAVKMMLDAILTCANGCCTADCFDPGCNPVTNEGCDAANGEACDFTGDAYACFPPDNDTPACGECDNLNGPFCEATLTCNSDADGNTGCTHYCCDDMDCSASATCDKADHIEGVGICVPK